jgi:rhodanese-related sulfurtransferase
MMQRGKARYPHVRLHSLLVLIALCIHIGPAFGAGGESFQDKYDFGTVRASEIVSHTFRINNTKPARLDITDVIPTCPCVSILSYPVSVPAGQSGELVVQVHATGLGQTQQLILVSTRGSSDGALRYLISGNFQGGAMRSNAETQQLELFTKLLSRKVKEMNRNLLLPPSSLSAGNKTKDEFTFIDIRSEAAYQRYHIKGSLNIPLYTIKTKSFLRDGKIVLFNDGYAYSELETEAERLRKAGYRAWIMTGGIHGWQAAGLPLEGTSQDYQSLSMVPPEAFCAEKDYDHWTIADISTDGGGDGVRLIPYAVRIPELRSKATFAAAWRTLTEKMRNAPPQQILIFSADGTGYEEMRNVIAESRVPIQTPIYYLSGGAAAYREFLGRQYAMIYQKSETSRTQPCPVCQ